MRKSNKSLQHTERHPDSDEEMSLPPRSTLHPSNKLKLIRSFYLTLIVLLVLLMVGLTIWGAKFAEAR